MTEIEKKALALVNEVREGRPYTIDEAKREYGWCFQAVCRAIEQHEAYRQEVSEIVEQYIAGSTENGAREWERLKGLIIPKPDPLVEDEDPIDALVDLLAPVLTHSQGMAARERENRFRNALSALAARGLKIVEDK